MTRTLCSSLAILVLCGGSLGCEQKQSPHGVPAATQAPPASPELQALIDQSRRALEEGRVRQALIKATEAVNQFPQRQSFELVSEIHLELAEEETATRYFEICTRKFPRQPDPWRLKGFHEYGLYRWPEAVQSFEQSLARDPNDPRTHNSMARTLQAMGDFDRALEHSQRAAELAPRDPLVVSTHARLLRIAGEYDESRRFVSAALQQQPRSPALHHALAQIHLREAKLDLAEKSLRRAIELNPRHREAHHDLARLLARTGRDLEARWETLTAERLWDTMQRRRAIMHRLSVQPENVDVVLHLAEFELAEGRVAQAQRWHKRAAELGGPGERLAAIEAELLFRRKQIEPARSVLSSIENSRSARAELARTAAQIALGELKSAGVHLQLALDRGPRERTFLRHAADLAESMGDRGLAIELLEKAAMAEPNPLSKPMIEGMERAQSGS